MDIASGQEHECTDTFPTEVHKVGCHSLCGNCMNNECYFIMCLTCRSSQSRPILTLHGNRAKWR